MFKNLLFVMAVVSSLFLAGCNQGDSTQPNGVTDLGPAEVSVGEVIATVNDEPITEETLTMISQANQRANIPREKLVDDLIKHELLYQEAVRKNLKKNPDVAKRLRFIQRSILSQAAMQDFIANTPISDTDIQKEYDEKFAGTGSDEYKARHILTKSEDKAKEIIQKLKDGGSFEELAKEYSTGPTGPKGGDLGWFGPQQMVGPFSVAVVALANGEYTQEPVKTQFGWHVILREDSRAKTPPPMAAMKANIQAQLQRKAIEKHLETLKSNAKIKITPKKPEAPASVKPAPIPASPATSNSEEAPIEKKPPVAEEKPVEPPVAQETAKEAVSSETEGPEAATEETNPKSK